MSDDIPLILLPGMGADARLFAAQLAAFPNLVVPAWIPPRRGESLRAYAARLAPLVDPGRACVVGGASFGGVVALEMAPHLPALACVLIGSVRSPAGLPARWRRLAPLARLGPDALGVVAGLAARLGVRPLGAPARRRLTRLARPEAVFARWAMCAVVLWRPSPAARRQRVFQIHGELDGVLPAARVGAGTTIVPGGAHAISLFNAGAVNEFLRGVLREVGAGD